jgi:PAS domain S-box-containing protein
MSRRIEELEQSNRLLQQKIQDLQQRENHFRSLLEGIPVGLYRTDLDGRILEVNPALVEMLGYGDNKEPLLSANSAQFYVNPEDLKEQRRILTRDGILRGFEMELRRADGSTFWVKDSAKVVENADGDVFFEGSLEDIDERKKMERSLLKSQHTMRGILDATLETIVLIDRRGTIVAANKTASHRLGFGIKDLIGTCVYDHFPADVAEDRKRKWERVFAEGRPLSFEDGRDGRTYAQSAYPVFDNNNDRVEHVVLFASDITERKQAEKNSRENEAKYRQLFELESDAIFLIDSSTGNILEVNHAATTTYGYTRDEFLKMNHTDVSAEPNETRQAALNGKTTIPIRYHKKKDGTVFPVEITASHFSWKEHNAHIAAIRDITFRIQEQEKRIELEKRLNQSHKMEAIGTLAGGIAHDLNNILSVIVGNTELAISDLPKWSSIQENLQGVRAASLRARDLIKQILLFAHQREELISNIHVEPIVYESLKMLRSSIPTTVNMEDQIQANLPTVCSNPSQIQQIIINLCTNAAQAMEDEGGTIHFSLDGIDLKFPLDTHTGTIPTGRYLRLKVADSGPGIPKENLERIIEPFFTTKNIGEGTGLGLSVVHGIVRARKGGMIVESENGEGAIFTIYLPASENAEIEGVEEEDALYPKGTEHILFVDDEPMILKLGKQMLEHLGYQVGTRASGTDALECFRQDPERFDLVATDMTMPGMRGHKLAMEILTIRPDIPIVLCTGNNKQISEGKAKGIGIQAFLMKPFTQQELASTVREVLDERPPKKPQSYSRRPRIELKYRRDSRPR